jgi:hypothetical protein
MEFQKLDKFAALLPEYIVGTRCEDHPHTGHTEQIRWGFPNNYGASVVCHNSSYGGAPEFVVLHDGRVWAASPVTAGVIPYITVSDAALYLARLRALRPMLVEESPSDDD